MNSVSAEEGLFSYLSFPCLGRSFPLNGFNCFLSRRRRRWRLILRVLRHFPFPPIKPLAERQSKRKVSPLQDMSLKSKRSADTLSSMETYSQKSQKTSQLGDKQEVTLLSVREMNGRLTQQSLILEEVSGIASAAAASVPRGQRVSIGGGRSSLAKELLSLSLSRVIIPHRNRWIFLARSIGAEISI